MTENTTTGGLVEELRALLERVDADVARTGGGQIITNFDEGRAEVVTLVRAALDAHVRTTEAGQPCRECGPGYHIGGEGCRHGSVADAHASRIECVAEVTYWDRPYDERIEAIRGMCDLTTDGMTPAPVTPHVESQASDG